MKAKIASLFAFLILVLTMLACSTSATPDTQATVDAAVQATRNAEKNAEATVEVAVEATVTQIAGENQSAIATAVQATLTAQPTPDYANLSEEELSAMIDAAVATAVADAEAASASTTSATSDGSVSAEEAAATTTTVYQTYYDVAYAQELIDAYYEYYGEYADAALETLNAMEDDLESIAQSLEEIDAIMTQGAETASAAIEKLNTAATNIQTKATEAQTKAQGLSEQVKTSLSQRETDALNLKPTQIESDKLGALTQVHDFLDTFKNALADGKFSPAELNKISQLSANARASLLKTGDPQLARLSGGIEGLTRNAARGDLGSARKGVAILRRLCQTGQGADPKPAPSNLPTAFRLPSPARRSRLAKVSQITLPPRCCNRLSGRFFVSFAVIRPQPAVAQPVGPRQGPGQSRVHFHPQFSG